MIFKKYFLKTVCIALSVLTLIAAVGCREEKKPAKKKKIIQQIVVVPNESQSEEPEQERREEYTEDDNTFKGEKRALYKPETEEKYIEKYSPEYSSRDAAWNGPDGYVIIYSDDRNYASAKLLQDFFRKNDGIAPEIKKDNSEITEKEILVGNTNRYRTELNEKKFAVSLKNDKLIFEGGHFAMVEKAVKWFTAEKRQKGSVKLISGEAKDFVSNITGGYKYVWGDEFDGLNLDDNKWIDNEYYMQPTTLLTALSGNEAKEKKVIAVEDGRLKIRTVRYFSELNSEAQYATGQVGTKDKMGFMYGYAEIKARVPMFKGTWPSWWMTTAWAEPLWKKTSDPNNGGKPYTYSGVPYRLEFDIFEVFSSKTDIVPNFHKWWDQSNAGKYVIPESGHTSYPLEISHYRYPEIDTRSNEYHIYSMKWTPKEITVGVDGNDYMTFDLKNGFNELSNEYNEYLAQPMQMIFTNFIYVEDLDAVDTAGKLIENESLPSEFIIDYIRIYQKENEGSIWTGNTKE